MRAAPKVMLPTLCCWPTTWEVDIGGMTIEAEHSHQYSVTFCHCVTDGSKRTVWQNSIWHWKCIWCKSVELNSSMRKELRSLTCINTYWMFVETKQWMLAQWCGMWCVSVVVTVTVGPLYWFQFLQAQHEGSCSLLAKMHGKNNVLLLKICSIKQCYCILHCVFHGNK